MPFVGIVLGNGLPLFAWRPSGHAVLPVRNVSVSLFLAMALAPPICA
ncbi:hypothetical protein [Burkholderia territorii]|nr:hypothetical protein [Burkholderia territorii]